VELRRTKQNHSPISTIIFLSRVKSQRAQSVHNRAGSAATVRAGAAAGGVLVACCSPR
jgi:hypothetical protein